MQKTVFYVHKMDCPSEETLIRFRFDDVSGIEKLEFNLDKRELIIYHTAPIEKVQSALAVLNLGERLLSTQQTSLDEKDSNQNQRRSLWIVLFINFSFFLIELIAGLLSSSMGLIADGLDMLADAFVYGISLIAVGATITRKKQVAKISGYFQLLLALIGFIEVIRRFFGFEQLPNFSSMIIVSIAALIANSVCLYILQKSKNNHEAHIKASLIFTSNDVIINIGVILAGVLVMCLNSNIPDLVVGSVVFIIVINGAGTILKLSK